MPSVRRMILGHVMSGLCSKMNRTKQLPADLMETPLNRCLNTFDITLLGKCTLNYFSSFLSGASKKKENFVFHEFRVIYVAL